MGSMRAMPWLLTAWVWTAAVRAQNFSTITSLFQIEIPNELYMSGGYRHKEAMFGSPSYGVTMTQPLYYANSDLCLDDWRPDPSWDSTYLLMVDRGSCTFVTKVRRAQSFGASGVIIADNRCICDDAECHPDSGSLSCENTEPIMADDGSGSGITIPAILLWKSDADKIKSYIEESPSVKIQAKLEWSLPNPDARVEWELWSTSTDDTSLDFLNDFKATAFSLGKDQFFTPHFYTWNGTAYNCRSTSNCGTLCTNGGRYCAPDPDRKTGGLEGSDVVRENLRRTCVWKIYGGKDLLASDPDRGVGRVWWDYISNFTELCYDDKNFASDFCVRSALAAAGADYNVVDQCMDESGGVDDDVPNVILEHELQQLADKNIYVTPECFVNGQSIWGQLSTSNVLEIICRGYSSESQPDTCGCLSFADNPDDARYKACLVDASFYTSLDGIPTVDVVQSSSKKKSSPASDYMPWWAIFLLVDAIILVMFFAAFVYWKKTQQQMRDQVRGILAEYMPLEDMANNNPSQTSNVLHAPGLSIQA